MGTSLYDRYLAETKPTPTAPTSLYDQYLASQKPPQNGAEKLHAEFKRGTLGGRMQRENANDMETAQAEDDAAHIPATAGLAALGHVFPGAEALQTFARVGSQRPSGNEAAAMAQHPLPNSTTTEAPQSYREAYNDIHGAVDKVPGKAALELAGSLPLAAVLPGSAAISGAILGGADQVLDANPDKGIAGRAVTGALGAAGGALLGKGTEMAVTGGRALLSSDPSKKLLAMQAERAASAARLYGAALQEGQGKAGTAAVQKFLAEPDIAEIVGGLKETHQFATTAPDSPEMLDAVYKTLSDRAAQIKKGLDAVSPTRPNIGRFRGQDVQSAQSRLLDALEAPGTKTVTTETAQSPPPSTRDAIDAFRARSGEAARRAQGGAIPDANPFSSKPNAETFAQKKARELLERSGAEDVVSPALSGSRTQTVETPPVMPSYRAAVVDFAKRSKEMEAFQKGYAVMNAKVSGGFPSAKNLLRTTEPAFGEWAAKHPENVPQATQGVMGMARSALLGKPLTAGRKAASNAPSLLRTAGSPTQSLYDMLTKAGLLGVNAEMQ